MFRTLPLLPCAFVFAFAGLVLALEQISAWESSAPAQPLRIVASVR